MLLTKEVEIFLNTRHVKHFMSKGYKIPQKIDKRGRTVTDMGIPIVVKTVDLPKTSGVKVDMICDYCGKISYTKYHNYTRTLNDDGTNYCYDCASTVLCSGENNYQWNDEKTHLQRKKDRKLKENRDFVKSVLDRDKYKCSCCGSNVDLVVHHLDGYNIDEEKRFDVTNGITLCKNCHKNFHSLYGYGDNTKEQYEDWVGKSVFLSEHKLDTTTRQIFCVEENKVYESANQIMSEWGLKKNSRIYQCCNKVKGCNMVKDKHLLWYDEYLTMSTEEIEKYVSERLGCIKKIICVNTSEIFENAKAASRQYGINSSHILECCKGNRKSAGRLNNEKMVWQYA